VVALEDTDVPTQDATNPGEFVHTERVGGAQLGELRLPLDQEWTGTIAKKPEQRTRLSSGTLVIRDARRKPKERRTAEDHPEGGNGPLPRASRPDRRKQERNERKNRQNVGSDVVQVRAHEAALEELGEDRAEG